MVLDPGSWGDGAEMVLMFLSHKGAASLEDAQGLLQWFSLVLGSDVKGVPSDPLPDRKLPLV